MEINIKGEPKEIAALVLAVQERRGAVEPLKINMDWMESLAKGISDEANSVIVLGNPKITKLCIQN